MQIHGSMIKIMLPGDGTCMVRGQVQSLGTMFLCAEVFKMPVFLKSDCHGKVGGQRAVKRYTRL